MKILAFTDSHGSLTAYKKIAEKTKIHNPDVIVCSGDLTIFEQNLDYFVHRISKLKKPVLLIHGNHEAEKDMKKAASLFKNILFLHGQAYTFNNTLFLFYGGSGFSFVDKNFLKLIPKFEKALKKAKKAVLVTHAPPYDTNVDMILDGHHGNKSIKNFIKKHKNKLVLALCGHLHENNGRTDKIGKCLIVNPGPYGKIINI